MNKMTFAAGAAIIAMTAMLGACSSDDLVQPTNTNDNVVRVEAGVGHIATRGFYAPGSAPEEFSLSIHNAASTDYTYNNISTTKSGDTWTTAQTLLWQNYDQPVDIYAYAPRKADYTGDIASDGNFPVSVEADQTAISDDNHTLDFLVYKQAGYKPQKDLTPRGTVNVEFTHALSFFKVQVVLGTEFDYPTQTDANSIKDLTIGGTVISGHCDFNATPLPTVSVVGGTAASQVKPYASQFTAAVRNEAGETTNATAEYHAMMLPQTIAAGNFTISFNINGKNYLWKAPNEIALAANTMYTLQLRAGLDRVVAGEITAKPWTDVDLGNRETE